MISTDNITFDQVRRCCGAFHISGFAMEDQDALDEFGVRTVKEWVAKVRAHLVYHINRMSNLAIFQLYLNECQNEVFGDAFESIGFKLVSQGYNKNSNSKNYLYTFVRDHRADRPQVT